MAIEVVATLTPEQNTQTVADLQPGDVVLWIARYSGTARGDYTFAANSQSTHLTLIQTVIVDEEEVDVEVSYTVPAHPAALEGAWAGWSGAPYWYQAREAEPSQRKNGGGMVFYGNLNSDGANTTLHQNLHVFVYPMTGFEAGAYKLQFNMPSIEAMTSEPIGAATLKVHWGKVLRGVDLATLGRSYEYPTYSVGRPGRQGTEFETEFNDFPVGVSLAGGATSGYMLAFLTGSRLDAPEEGYGTEIGAYYDMYQDGINTLAYDLGVVTGTTTFPEPPNGVDYNVGLSWFLLYGGAASVPPTRYFVDVLVLNAKTGATVEY